MAEDLSFRAEAAAEYDRAFAHVTRYLMPSLLQAAGVAAGMRVLDIATGTGLIGRRNTACPVSASAGSIPSTAAYWRH
jgi:hypothetical protein